MRQWTSGPGPIPPLSRSAARSALTAPRCVKRIYTNLAVIDVTEQGLMVLEMVPGLTLDELQAQTEPQLHLAASYQALTPPAKAA